MAHEIDFQTGRAAIAYVGTTPWHGLGQVLTPDQPLEVWQQEAGLDWTCREAMVRFDRKMVDTNGAEVVVDDVDKSRKVLYRSDTGSVLSVMSDKYRPVQPKEIIEFYRDLTEQYGFQLETAGSLRDGKRIWALANTHNAFQLRGKDDIKAYLLLATSFDGTMATQARFTSIRVVCNNTLAFATDSGKAEVVVPHSTTFDADRVKLDLKVGKAWQEFEEHSREMSKRLVSQDESVRFFLDVYYGLDTVEKIAKHREEERNQKSMDKFVERMQHALFNSPGAHMESARGMLWGLVSAVTFDVDHQLPSRSQDTRLNKAWFGQGHNLKQRAWNKAMGMIA